MCRRFLLYDFISGTAYMIFYHRNKASFLSRWLQWITPTMSLILRYFMQTNIRNWPDTKIKMFHLVRKEILSKHLLRLFLTHSWRKSLSYRKQSIDLQSKSMDCFLYDRNLRHERIKWVINLRSTIYFAMHEK